MWYVLLFALFQLIRSQIITTIAGSTSIGFNGDGGSATSSALYYPRGVAIDSTGIGHNANVILTIIILSIPYRIGNIYFADSGNHRIRKVTVSNGIVTTVAGSTSIGFSGDGGQATSAALQSPYGVSLDSTGISMQY